ncbi:YadA-like family protein [Mesorhizobium sp. VK4C]|uniref:YadA-like family protein n=1 Tax=Mesorhizobium captivum TaxID=3072319 RepID=UPI002A2467FC|nr:YadA-like family protein [Mesorhizobium sp. VK4C]MDX8499363.1 YadA-like family protein [Mesorhizobium sp. VK4C]
MNFRQGRTIRLGAARFAGNWVSGAADSRSLRRRLMAALRNAHRVLGVKRNRLGLGMLGGGASLACLVSAALVFTTPAHAQYAAGGGSATVSNSIAIGNSASATNVWSIALGTQTVSSAQYSVAIGLNASATGTGGAMALGMGTVSSGVNTVALGVDASATGAGASALGTFSVASGGNSTAVGVSSTASNNFAFAGGWASVASGDSSTAVGRQAVASAIDAAAFGYIAQATGQYSTAIGPNANASATSSTAIGQNTFATDFQATALGAGASAVAANSIAVGSLAGASGVNASSFGSGANATGDNSLAAGVSANAGGIGSTALGIGTVASGNESAAVGFLASAAGQSSAALGRSANASADFSLALGNGSVSSGVGAVSAGAGAQSTAFATVAIGNNAAASAQNAIAAGTGAVANSADAVAIGTAATATGGKAVSIGSGNTAYGDGAVSIGDPSYASGTGAVTSGANNIANSDGTANATASNQAPGAVAIGNNNKAIGQGSVALGNGSTAGAAGFVGNVALGNGATATASSGDVALGSGSVTDVAVGTGGTTIGGVAYGFAGTTPTSTVSIGAPGAERTLTNLAAGRISGSSTDAINGSQLFATNQQVTQNTTDIANLSTSLTDINSGAGIKYFHANSTLADSQALGTDSVAIGPNAVATNAGDVAIGLNAVSGTTTAVGGTTIGGVNYTFAGGTPAGAFSVGSVGAERQIQNVAAGQLNGSSTDAVNGSQLFATNQQVTQNTTDIAANTADITTLGNTINNFAGDTSTVYTDANGDGIRYVRTNDSTLPVADAFAQGVGSSALGYQATASAGDSLALGRGTQATILGGVALGAGSVSDRAVAPVSGSILSGTGLIPYNTTDMTLLGAVSVGTSTAYRQIINVADGTQDQDAVTLRQLKGALSSFAVTGTMYFHANSTASDSLAVGAESVAIGPRTTVNGDNGIGMGNGAIVQQTAPGGIAIGQNATVNQADSIAFGTNSTANGAQSTALGAGATANEPGSVALGAGSTTAAAVATTGTTINGVAYTFAGTTPTSTVSVGSAGNERTVTNVAAGRISDTSTDAINGSQLYATNQAVEAMQGSVGDLNEFAIQYDKNGDGSKSNSVTLVGGDVNAPVVIHNVGAGTADTDAVNVKQLNDGLALNLTDSKTYTNQVAATTLQQANAYADSKLSQLNMDMGEVRGEARQAAAIGLAAASLRYDDRPGKLSVAAGGGYWRGEGAVAFGAGYTSEDGRARANVSGTTAGGHWGVGAGVSFTLN